MNNRHSFSAKSVVRNMLNTNSGNLQKDLVAMVGITCGLVAASLLIDLCLYRVMQ